MSAKCLAVSYPEEMPDGPRRQNSLRCAGAVTRGSACPRVRVYCGHVGLPSSSRGFQVCRSSPCDAPALGDQRSHASGHRADQDITLPGSTSGRAEIVARQSWQSQFALISQTSDLTHLFASSQIPSNPPSIEVSPDSDSRPLPHGRLTLLAGSRRAELRSSSLFLPSQWFGKT